mgnify:CR=1 FL=1
MVRTIFSGSADSPIAFRRASRLRARMAAAISGRLRARVPASPQQRSDSVTGWASSSPATRIGTGLCLMSKPGRCQRTYPGRSSAEPTLLWLEPVLATYIHRRIESVTLLLVDASASMSMKDLYPAPVGRDRAETALD